ncbi:MAG: hypothetical protein KKE62_14415 [Proteobacteria bacterium]|nr:hypothetical protein [Pseudomonadota bacterium]MBU1387549.1 hypothetical protein [Pseudomonadota bacterium]MBU1544024.1 hypothetical protein [Pseudomonadota bacterium]MBU2430486.1 hypothetical protein [Pseudomonadota bacterium]MBU2479746.1 hypothetical protein [Pseudomonadota bacterium]
MTLKKIAVILIIIMILGGGLFAYQKNRQTKALAQHNRQKFVQIMEIAQKDHSAGLLDMASRINKYHQLKGQYPKDLMQLHPEFIPEKSFITTLNWNYETNNNTFFLKRQTGGAWEYAMGPDMRLQAIKKGELHLPQKIAAVKTAEKNTRSSADPDTKRKTDMNKDVSTRSNIVLSYIHKPLKPLQIEKTQEIPQEYTVVEKALNEDEKFLLSLNAGNLYIWKTPNGVIGFSNIQYPDSKNLTIYKNKAWVEYKYNQTSGKQK